MDCDVIAARRESFRSVTPDYERTRPQYPVDAIVWAVGEELKQIVDIGCGPGKLTSQLADFGHRVVGVDLSMTMLQAMTAKGLPAVCGVAEAIPLKNDFADVVTAAQAFHWFDLDLALPEIRRLLRDDGHLVLLWNLRDESVEWVQDLSAIVGSEDAQAATLGDTERFEKDPSGGKFLGSQFFGALEHRVFAFEQSLDEEQLLGLVRSRSYFAILPEKERADVLTAVSRLWRERAEPGGTLTLPYRTHVFRTRANG